MASQIEGLGIKSFIFVFRAASSGVWSLIDRLCIDWWACVFYMSRLRSFSGIAGYGMDFVNDNTNRTRRRHLKFLYYFLP